MAPLPNGFPSDQRASNAAQARLSSDGVSFLEENVGSLAGLLLPEGGTITVTPNCNDLCCSDGTPDVCRINLDLEPQQNDPPRLELNPTAPSRLELTLRARVKTLDTIHATAAVVGACTIDLNTEQAGAKSVTVKLKIDLTQDAVTGTTSAIIVPDSVSLTDLDDGDINFGGGGLCFLGNILKFIVVNQVKDVFTSQVQNLITDQLCKKCDDNADCAPFGSCGGDGVCTVNGADPARCVQELGIAGRLGAASLLSGISPGLTGAIDLYLVAGGFAESKDNGLSLGLLGGTVPSDAKHDACVPVRPAPSIDGIPRSAVFDSNARPDGQPFHLGIGIHEKFLDKAAWAAYDSGFLCVNVGARSIELLNTTALGLLFPSVTYLLHGEEAPAVIGLRPQNPPTFHLGAGTFAENGDILEPLITISFKTLEVDLYVMIDQRYARVATVQTDLDVPIGLDTNAQGQLVPVISKELTMHFTKTTAFNDQLLSDGPEHLATTFPILIGSVLPSVLGGIGGITLPEVAGLQIKIGEGGITSVDDNSVLAIFTTLQPGGSAKLVTPVDTRARVLAVHRPDTAGFASPQRDNVADRPSVELELGGDLPLEQLEWQFLVDRGLWSPWTRSPAALVSEPSMWLQGKHNVQVRARRIGEPASADPTPVSLDVLIDSVEPKIQLTREGEAVRIEAVEHVSSAADLRVRYRVAGEWHETRGVPALVDLEGTAAGALEVEVIDEAGNVGKLTGGEAGFHGQPPPASSGCDCRVGGGRAPAGSAALAVAALVGLVLFRRRRLLAALALFVIGCGGDTGGTPPDDQPDAGEVIYPPNSVKPGALGLFLDLAAEDGRVVAVGYEETFGDLVLADVTAEGGVALQPVDGVPFDAPPSKDPEGYRRGIEVKGDNVGAYASVVLSGGQARVAYQHLGDLSLLYGHEDGEGWSRHVVDSVDGAAVGLYNSMTSSPDGKPGIAYMATYVPDGAGFKSQLRFAESIAASPAASSDWDVTVVHEARISCAGLCGTSACLAATRECVAPSGDCGGPCGDNQACVEGSCQATLEPPPYADLPDGPGLFASAGRLSNGDVVVAFYDRTGGDLLLATRTAGTWAVTPLAAGAETDMGQWCSLAVGDDDTIHIAFQDALTDSLAYLSVKDGAASPIETIDDGLRTDRPHAVGAASAAFVDGAGFGVVYQDAATSDLLYGRKDGTWVHDDFMAGDNNFGFYNSAAIDGATTWVGTFTYDLQKEPPGEVFVKKLP